MPTDENKVLTKEDTYSVARIIQIRDNIRRTIRKTSNKTKYMGLEFDDRVWDMEHDDIIDNLVPVFAGATGGNHNAVHQSLHSLLRMDPITIGDVDDVAWIMAGNQQKLKVGEAVEPFVNVVHEEWVPTCIQDYEKVVRYGSKGVVYTFKVFGGSPTTHKIKKFFNTGKESRTYKFFKHAFSLQQWAKFSYRELVGMRIWVLLNPDQSQAAGRPTFTHMQTNPTFEAHNRALLRDREKSCLVYPELTTWDCCMCPHGLVSCCQATHSVDYQTGECDTCGNLSLFEEGYEGDTCLICRENRNFRIGLERSK